MPGSCWAQREVRSWTSSVHGELTSRGEFTDKQAIIGQGGRCGARPTGFLCATSGPRLSPDLARRQGRLVLGSDKGAGTWRKEHQHSPYPENSARPQLSLGRKDPRVK